MKVLIVFLLGAFVSAASPSARRWLSKPWVLLIVCMLVAASFLSLRVVGG
jgi:hypothetical protein